MTRIGEKWTRCPKRKLTPLVKARLKELDTKIAKGKRVTLGQYMGGFLAKPISRRTDEYLRP